jgi:small subunit ribosomal protein S8
MDTVGNLLTSIRNANAKFKDRVDVPHSKLKSEIARLLKEEGFIQNFKVVTGEKTKKQMLRLFLKYSPEKERVIKGLQRVSKPGLRIYRSYKDIPRVRGGGFPITILSTSHGVLTDKQAKEKKVGGEVLCQIW